MMVKAIVTDKKALAIPCRDVVFYGTEAMPVIQNLMDTAHFHKDRCVGLASNQVGSDLRVFVIKYRGKFIAFVNPSFNPEGTIIKSTETCLSFPGKKTTVDRHTMISTSPPLNKKNGLCLDGISAIAFQHEFDHLNGVTI